MGGICSTLSNICYGGNPSGVIANDHPVNIGNVTRRPIAVDNSTQTAPCAVEPKSSTPANILALRELQSTEQIPPGLSATPPTSAPDTSVRDKAPNQRSRLPFSSQFPQIKWRVTPSGEQVVIPGMKEITVSPSEITIASSSTNSEEANIDLALREKPPDSRVTVSSSGITLPVSNTGSSAAHIVFSRQKITEAQLSTRTEKAELITEIKKQGFTIEQMESQLTKEHRTLFESVKDTLRWRGYFPKDDNIVKQKGERFVFLFVKATKPKEGGRIEETERMRLFSCQQLCGFIGEYLVCSKGLEGSKKSNDIIGLEKFLSSETNAIKRTLEHYADKQKLSKPD